jgi:predicted component of type VI protein secretion system
MKFPNIKHFPTYWENGMKLSAGHFQHLENSIEDAQRDIRALGIATNGGYGLLPNSDFSLQNAQGLSPQSVRVILNACKAILPGGYRVEIVPHTMHSIQVPNEAPFVEFVPRMKTRFHIYLSVSAESRKPSGIPETRPIRHPYLSHDYQLECIPTDKLSSASAIAANRMKIAEWQDGKILEGYIPATLRVEGFPLLDKWHKYLHNQLENIVRLCSHVINSNRRKDEAKVEFCLPIVHFIRGNMGHFKWAIPMQAPAQLCAFFGDLAGLIEGLIETSDRDFVRNRLDNGQVHRLRPTIHQLLNMERVPLEEMAMTLGKVQQFVDALIRTIQSLEETQAPSLKSGDRNEA